MARVLVSDPIADSAVKTIDDAGIELVHRDHEKDGPLEELIKGFDGIIVRSATKVTRGVIQAADQLKVIVRAGVGLDNVDLEAAKDNGVEVLNTPEAPTVSVAEMVFSLMFALARNVTQADSSMKDERWEKKKLRGVELWKKNLGIAGFGRIGQEVARMGKAFGMNILSYGGSRLIEASKKIGASPVSLDELLAQSDYLSLHVPMKSETEGMIGSKEFKKMRESAFLINTARGGVVDEEALLAALDQGQIAGAGVDVFENEPPVDWALAKHPKVVATPHLASSTFEAQNRVGELTAEKIIDFFK
ncbi:hydroxyacid dehydrogenase [Candidatus Thorarchaeota archaeon]|nr:MAG: hydroxyacid dehydrogenase [Candidatus Thorarchaeota archaeon]